MDWSNWVNLGMVLGVGMGFGWLLASRQRTDANVSEGIDSRPSSTPVSSAVDSQAQVSQPSPDRSHNELISQLKAELNQLKLDYYLVEQMYQFKAGFLARVTHELRSPINGLIGAHQLILSDLCDSPEEEREFLANANTSAVKMIDMIDKILDVSRTDCGKSPISLEPLQLAEILQEVHYLTEMQAANRNIPLNLVNPDSDIYVLGDEKWLTPVLVNLIDSAITTDDLGSISVWVETNKESGDARILVSSPRNRESWSESVDLLTQELNRPTKKDSDEIASEGKDLTEIYQKYPLQPNPDVSAGLNLVMTYRILELMQGRLEILPTPADAQDGCLTIIQCLLPLVDPPAESD